MEKKEERKLCFLKKNSLIISIVERAMLRKVLQNWWKERARTKEKMHDAGTVVMSGEKIAISCLNCANSNLFSRFACICIMEDETEG